MDTIKEEYFKLRQEGNIDLAELWYIKEMCSYYRSNYIFLQDEYSIFPILGILSYSEALERSYRVLAYLHKYHFTYVICIKEVLYLFWREELSIPKRFFNDFIYHCLDELVKHFCDDFERLGLRDGNYKIKRLEI